MKYLWLGCLLLILTSWTGASPIVTDGFVWLEAEQPTDANFEFMVASSARPKLLSDGRYLLRILHRHQRAKEMPEGGWHLKYRFDAPHTDRYHFWSRLSFEFIRAPFQWRIDEGPWRDASAEIQTDNLMELSTWNEIAWANYGAVQLNKGSHVLELRFEKAGTDGRLLIGLDSLVLAREPFHPNLMHYAPVERIDQEAAKQVFAFDLPSLSKRRPTLALTGLWQVARHDDPDMDEQPYEPVRTLPDETIKPLRWLGISVPGNAWQIRKELTFGHRLLYRTRVDIPDAFERRGFHLHFSGTNWITSVFVNGQLVDTHQSVLVPWDLDITHAITPGKRNQITIAIKSPWYAIDTQTNQSKTPSLDHTRNTPAHESFAKHRNYVAPVFPSTKGEGNGMATGLVNPVTLIVTGRVYTQDAFIQTRLTDHTLTADLTLRNTTHQLRKISLLCQVIDAQTGEIALTLPAKNLTLQANATTPVQLQTTWPNPKLWWPQENAAMYRLRCELTEEVRPFGPQEGPQDSALKNQTTAKLALGGMFKKNPAPAPGTSGGGTSGGQRLDQRKTSGGDVFEQTFGFREITLQGKDFLINGTPHHFWNWSEVPNVHTPKQWLKAWREQGNRFHRISYDHDKVFKTREAALDFFDTHGIPGRLSTCIDGMFITHDLNNPLVWKNFQQHVQQVVKAYRNHPSIMMYSLGNEMMFVTAFLRNGGNFREIEKRMANLNQIAKQLDPTRESFQDGGGDLGGLGKINAQHYAWLTGEQFPASAYQYNIGPYQKEPPHQRAELFKWTGNNPLVLGEVFYYSGNVSKMAWIGGPRVFRSRAEADMAAGRFCRISIEGARWQGVTAICPWTKPLPGVGPAMSPHAVFVREHASTLNPNLNPTVQRTIKVFNDTSYDNSPIELHWLLTHQKNILEQGQKTYTIMPGHAVEDTLQFQTPRLNKPGSVMLTLQLVVQNKVVFTDHKQFSVLLPQAVTAPDKFFVFDPSQKVLRWLKQRAVAHGVIQTLSQVPKLPQVLLVGPDAVTADNLQQVASLAKRVTASGGTVLMLEQQHILPLTDLTLGEDAKPDARAPRAEFENAKGYSGRIAFITAPAHPVMKGLTDAAFFTWAKDEWSFRSSYATPTGRAIALLGAGDQLKLTPMLQYPSGRGSYLLSQMLIGHKLDIEPAANQLLANMINWAGQRQQTNPKTTFAFTADDKALDALLKRTGMVYQTMEKPEDLFEKMPGIAIMRATGPVMTWLRQNRQAVRAYLQNGNQLMLVNLTVDAAQTLEDFNVLVGFPHRLRKGFQERVRLQNQNHPLLLGIGEQDLSMYSDQYMARWKNLKAVSDRVFSFVVDGEEIASFAQLPNHRYRKTVNGLTNDDFWRYILYLPAQGEKIRLQLDRPERLNALHLWTNETYKVVQDIELVFDSDPRTTLAVRLKNTKQRQIINFPPRVTQTLDIHLLNSYPLEEGVQTKDLVGIDNLELYRTIPPAMAKQAILLSKPGGLAVYPIDQGNILLNNLDYQQPDTPENQQKKLRIWTNLLRNLGVTIEY